MVAKFSQPTCCEVPLLISMRMIERAAVSELVLQRCRRCQSFWLVTNHEHRSMETEPWQKYRKLNAVGGTEFLRGSSDYPHRLDGARHLIPKKKSPGPPPSRGRPFASCWFLFALLQPNLSGRNLPRNEYSGRDSKHPPRPARAAHDGGDDQRPLKIRPIELGSSPQSILPCDGGG